MDSFKKIMLCSFSCMFSLINNPIVQSPSPNFLLRYDHDSGQQILSTLLVLHYTVVPMDRVIKIFEKTDTPTPVSSHYTVDQDGTLYQHVPESLAARHAGVAYWRGLEGPDPLQKKLNLCSIGVEHVNFGFRETPEQPRGITVHGSDKEWYVFDERQIATSIALCKDILARNPGIKPQNVLGHSDIAPRRKDDPGPLFPWKKFAQEGVGAWPDYQKMYALRCLDVSRNASSEHTWFMQHLHLWGYRSPQAEVTQEDLVRAFQMHFRPENIDGKIDSECIAILQALFCEYIVEDNICPCEKTPENLITSVQWFADA